MWLKWKEVWFLAVTEPEESEAAPVPAAAPAQAAAASEEELAAAASAAAAESEAAPAAAAAASEEEPASEQSVVVAAQAKPVGFGKERGKRGAEEAATDESASKRVALDGEQQQREEQQRTDMQVDVVPPRGSLTPADVDSLLRYVSASRQMVRKWCSTADNEMSAAIKADFDKLNDLCQVDVQLPPTQPEPSMDESK